MALTKITNSAIADDIGLGGNPTTSTQTAGNSTTRIATTAFVSTAVANLVDSAPDTLNTLAELATSIGNNATLSSTLTSSIATKLPLAGGTLTGHLNLGDNVRARFGIGNDLQIYHNNNSSYIRDLGEGSLYIDTNGPKISLISDGSYSNGKMADFVRDGAVTLYYDNALKLATTTIGIDVTGSVLTDGLTSAGTILATSSTTISTVLRGGDGNSKNLVFQKTTGSAQQAKISAVGDDLRFTTGTTTERMRIDSSGNVGIGTTAPGSLYATARQLVIGNGTADVGMTIYTPNTGIGRIFFADGLSNGDQYAAFISYDHSNHKMQFGTGNTGTTDVTIDQYGKVGIGTTAPSSFYSGASQLVVGAGSGESGITLYAGASSISYLLFADGTSGTAQYAGQVNYNHGTNELGFCTNNVTTPRMVVDATGNVGIGTADPGAKLEIASFSSGAGLRLNYGNSNGTVDAINFISNGGANGAIGMQMVSAGVGDLWLGGSGGRSLTIYRNGNVGIGVTDPTSKLTVAGDALATRIVGRGVIESSSGFSSNTFAVMGVNTSNSAVNHGAVFASKHADSNALLVGSHDATFNSFAVKGDGKVGIGTTTPQHELVIHNASNPTLGIVGSGYNDLIAIRFGGGDLTSALGNGNSGAAILSQQAVVGGQAKGDLQFQINTGDSLSTAMFIKNDGNVGIGTTNPTNHINTGSFFKPDSNGKFLTVNGGANGSFIMLESQTTTDNDQIGGIYWNRTGAQGDAHKQVAGIDVIQDAYAANNTLEGGTLRFFTKQSGSGLNTPRMVIAGSGNVGIGTDSPGANKLKVYNSTVTGNTQLHIHNDKTGDAAVIKLEGKRTSLNDTGQLIFANNGNNVAKIDARSAADDGELRFFTSASGTGTNMAQKMVIDKSGNVGIGTASPGGSKLNVTASSTALAGEFLNSGTSGYGLRVTTHSTGAQYGFAVDSYGGGYSRDFTVGADGNVNVLTGNLVIGTAGKGIDFSATSSNGTSELLDDYEEGTWTPSLPSGGSLTVNRALYTKIGRQVSVQFYIAAINATNDGAQFKIGNLPFITSGISSSYSAGSISYCGQSDLGGLGLLNIVNSTSLYFHFIDGTSGSSVANNTFRGLLASASAGVLIAEISYFTDQ